MTEREWLTSTDPAAMLGGLNGVGTPLWHTVAHVTPGGVPRPWPISERKLRLFACALCRQVWDKLTDERSRIAVEVAERYADGQAEEAETVDAVKRAIFSKPPATPVRRWLHSLTSGSFRDWCLPRVIEYSLEAGVTYGLQAAVLRDTAGNPFRPLPILRVKIGGNMGLPEPPLHPWLAWNSSMVLRLAEAVYAERAFERLPILADALEDAGCTEAPVLDHLRRLGPHARGCWVLDLLMGKQ